jgi:putative restriction endonuclease
VEAIIQKYFTAFGKLKRGVTPYGLAPHKPILLLSLLQAVQNKLVRSNQFFVTPELVLLFKSNWNCLITTQHVCNFALPFFHLSKEKAMFWHLAPNNGFESILKTKESISSIGELNASVSYAILNSDLFELMLDEKSNYLLQYFLLDTYFPETKANFSYSTDLQQKLFTEIEDKILNETAAEYKREMQQLIIKKDEEEIFLRGSLFKREIPKIYNNTCCISGMRIETATNISMIDACHIIPFSVSYDDTVSNGISLCPNLHRAFDRGLIAIDASYRVMLAKNVLETPSSFMLREFEGKEILLPKVRTFMPMQQNFEWHRRKFEFE